MKKLYSGFSPIQCDDITLIKSEAEKKIVATLQEKTVHEFAFTSVSIDRVNSAVLLTHGPSGETRQIVTNEKVFIDQFAE